MRLLVDGNNLMFALLEHLEGAGRATVCKLLGDWAERTGAPSAVVFDGPAPDSPLAQQLGDPRIEVYYSGRRKADDLIIELIHANTAPRRLTVVSTDREIREAARRRRCRSVRSEDFAMDLTAPPPPKTPDPEPRAKRRGPTGREKQYWREQFGLARPEENES